MVCLVHGYKTPLYIAWESHTNSFISAHLNSNDLTTSVPDKHVAINSITFTVTFTFLPYDKKYLTHSTLTRKTSSPSPVNNNTFAILPSTKWHSPPLHTAYTKPKPKPHSSHDSPLLACLSHPQPPVPTLPRRATLPFTLINLKDETDKHDN